MCSTATPFVTRIVKFPSIAFPKSPSNVSLPAGVAVSGGRNSGSAAMCFGGAGSAPFRSRSLTSVGDGSTLFTSSAVRSSLESKPLPMNWSSSALSASSLDCMSSSSSRRLSLSASKSLPSRSSSSARRFAIRSSRSVEARRSSFNVTSRFPLLAATVSWRASLRSIVSSRAKMPDIPASSVAPVSSRSPPGSGLLAGARIRESSSSRSRRSLSSVNRRIASRSASLSAQSRSRLSSAVVLIGASRFTRAAFSRSASRPSNLSAPKARVALRIFGAFLI